MTPEQIKQWQDEHGGADGDPSPPDSRGLVTYRASDGAWVVVGKNGQLVSRGSKPGAIDEKGPGYTEPGQTPSAAPSSGVGPTTQQELEARVAKNPALVYRGQTLKTKTIPGLPGLGDKQIQVPVVSWVDPATGQTLTAEIGDGGAYTVTEDGIVASNKAATAASSNPNTPEGKNAAELQRQREKNAALPPEQDPAYETDKERRDRADVRIKGQGAAANAAKPTTVNTSATEPFIAQQTPDGIKWIPNQNYVGEKPTTSTQKGPDGLTYVISVDKSGNASAKPVQGLPATPSGALPADAPQPSGRLGEAAADLQAFDQYLNAQVRSVPPKMTVDQADKLREARRSFWATALSEQQGIVNTQKGVYDSQSTARNATLSDLSNRRTNATQIANQASSDLMPLMTKMGPNAANGPSLAAAIRASRNNAMDFVTMSGANRMVPEVGMGPALTSVNGMPLPGGTAASPQMGPGFNPRGGPNGAIGLGAVGSVPAPGGPAAAIFRPQPPAIYPGPGGAPAVAASAAATPSAPQPAASAPSPASGGPAPMTAAQAAAYEQGGINPATGDIDVRTTPPSPVPQPVNQMPVNVPYPNNAGAESRAPMFAPPTFLAAASRGHVHDPTGVIREMIADPRYDNATLRAVLAEQYPGYNIDALMQGAA